ncbi:MAG: AAA family ATPase [Actinomycetota bacterium]
MRPTRLEVEGFASFRDSVAIDFADADYFALVGDTGSGKSSLIDAMCFALYGSVPRYGHKGLVFPVITQGQLEAKVRLDFAIGEDPYTAVRVVRRTPKGATTREARLERGTEVLAGTADDLTAEVERLIGLSFEHFCKCVVLPQGEFARFLHDEPSKRQDMLVRLLSLDVYERMREQARRQSDMLKNKAELAEQRLEQDFAFATLDNLRNATARVKELRALRKKIDAAVPALRELDASVLKLHESVEARVAQLKLLESIRVPDDVAELADRGDHARKLLAEAKANEAQAKKAMTESVATRAELPPRDPLAAAVVAHQRRGDLLREVKGLEHRAATLRTNDAAAQAGLKAAVETLARARTDEVEARDRHAALHLAASLEKGEPCPVCAQTVTVRPRRSRPPDLDKAAATIAAAEAAIGTTRDAADEAARALGDATANIALLENQITACDKEVAEFPDPAEAAATLARVDAADAGVEGARRALDEAREQIEEAQAALGDIAEVEGAARRRFQQARDGLIALTPPSVAGEDLASDWSALVEWARDRTGSLGEEIATERADSERIQEEHGALVSQIERACADCAVEIGDDHYLAAAIGALKEAEHEVKGIEKAIADAAALSAQIKECRVEHEVTSALAHHLSAKGFEKWIVNEALRRLVTGASDILRGLSNEQYSLALDDSGSFLVTDHYNADETRSAKTLSGGETFLASLSLALALADQLVELAAEGAARLEAIFLDEGFGTLDPEKLDVIASTVENLSTRGRMVGIVTHVKDLAERVPVQFKVTKDGRTSNVERIAV